MYIFIRMRIYFIVIQIIKMCQIGVYSENFAHPCHAIKKNLYCTLVQKSARGRKNQKET